MNWQLFKKCHFKIESNSRGFVFWAFTITIVVIFVSIHLYWDVHEWDHHFNIIFKYHGHGEVRAEVQQKSISNFGTTGLFFSVEPSIETLSSALFVAKIVVKILYFVHKYHTFVIINVKCVSLCMTQWLWIVLSSYMLVGVLVWVYVLVTVGVLVCSGKSFLSIHTTTQLSLLLGFIYIFIYFPTGFYSFCGFPYNQCIGDIPPLHLPSPTSE